MKSYKSISLILVGILVIASVLFYFNNKNQVREIQELEKENVVLSEEIKNPKINTDTESNSYDFKDNTFDDDINWFITEVYELNDRLELYDNVSFSITDNVLEILFGENIPPEPLEVDFESSLKREVKNIEIYGKYLDADTFHALATFDLYYNYENESESAFIVSQVNLKKFEDDWLINDFEELVNLE